VIQSRGPADTGLAPVGSGGEELAAPEPMDVFELAQRMVTVMPEGYELGQIRSEHPSTTYGEFKREILAEAFAALVMPYNVGAHDSSEFNYASGKLDRLTYARAVRVEQSEWEIDCLDRVFWAWFDEAALIPGYLPAGLPPAVEWTVAWYWDGLEDIDPEKAARSQRIKLESGQTSYPALYAAAGLDHQTEMTKQAESLGLSLDEYRRRLADKLLGPPKSAQPAVQAKPSAKAPPAVRQEATAMYDSRLRSRERIRAASVPSELVLVDDVAALEIEAATGDDPKRLPTFRGTAYTGGLMRLAGYYRPVVVDLAGVKIHAATCPVLRDHDHRQIVGHGRAEIAGGKISVSGVVSGAGPAATEVVEASRRGFPWRLSIGASADKVVSVDDGERVEVNGRTLVGPILVARKTTLGEISFVPIAADARASVKVAASAAKPIEVVTMEFEQWLEAKGFDLAALGDTQRESLEAMFDAEQAAAAAQEQATDEAVATITAAGEDGQSGEDNAGGEADPLAEFRARQAGETRRLAAIRRLCAGRHHQIEARAIEEGWDERQTELEVMRAQRPTGPAIQVIDKGADSRVLEAAIRSAGEESEGALTAEYGAQTLERAERFRKIGFRGLFELCCRAEGVSYPMPASVADNEFIRAAFSTASLSGILGNTANKSMWAAYRSVDSAARTVAKKLSTNDFKQQTGYRLTGDFVMKEVGQDGELKHATIDEESFTYQVKTYGRIFGITRQMAVNDDLGAFTEIPRMIGRGAALALEDAFFTLVLANTGSFFSTANKNYVEGASYVLGSEGLKKAVETFRKQTDADGNPIAMIPKFLLVPPEIEATADELYVSTNVNTGGSSTKEKVPNRNVYAGKYTPVVSPYLSNSNYTGYSATAYYLLADPADAASFGIAYLNGVERPTIEDAPLRSDLLGRAWRGYFDFGVCQVDKRAGVKMKGAA